MIFTCLITQTVAMDPQSAPRYDILGSMVKWNGHPYFDFRTHWWALLISALAGVVQSGETLLACARRQDRGRPGDVVPQGEDAALTAQHQQNHLLRKVRLAACIRNYIDSDSYLYYVIGRAPFVDGENRFNGPQIFEYLYVYGHMERDNAEKQKLLREWEEATMASVNIKINEASIFKWLEWVQLKGEILNKGLAQRRKKFLDGFPEAFDNVIAAERLRGDDGSFTQPAQFPAGHPQAGQANPNHNRADLDAMARAYHNEWLRRLSQGLLRNVPRGMAREVCVEADDPSDRDEEVAAAVSKAKVTADFICTWCGGRGHASEIDGLGSCLTKKLGLKIPIDELKQTRYPRELTFPSFSSSMRNKGKAIERRRDQRRGKFTKRKQVREVIEDEESGTSELDSEDNNDETAQSVQHMAVQYNNLSLRSRRRTSSVIMRGYDSYDDEQ